MGKKHSYESLAPKMNFFGRLIWRIKFRRAKQVTLIHRHGLNWIVATRNNAMSPWKERGRLSNKRAEQAFKYVRANYPGYLYYLPEAAVRKAALAQRMDSLKNGITTAR